MVGRGAQRLRDQGGFMKATPTVGVGNVLGRRRKRCMARVLAAVAAGPEAEQARVAGQISDEDLAHVQGQAVGRLLS